MHASIALFAVDNVTGWFIGGVVGLTVLALIVAVALAAPIGGYTVTYVTADGVTHSMSGGRGGLLLWYRPDGGQWRALSASEAAGEGTTLGPGHLTAKIYIASTIGYTDVLFSNLAVQSVRLSR